MTVPDVTVVIAVYNTMPYLTACLDSLVRQTVGHARMEVVAVDDGSTDGCGELLDTYAARHPGLFQVVHQANSGGPAAPTNRGLALARGRYVLFLGADDWLGDEALARMVASADEWRSDVLIPKQVGVNGRLVPQGIFDATAASVGFEDSALAWALADTKLFRLDLIRRHNLARKEELKVYSDQPFTLAACLRARRISVLADYDHYFLVLREDRGNVTQRAWLRWTGSAGSRPCSGWPPNWPRPAGSWTPSGPGTSAGRCRSCSRRACSPSTPGCGTRSATGSASSSGSSAPARCTTGSRCPTGSGWSWPPPGGTGSCAS